MRVLYFTRDYTTHDRRFLLKLAQSRHEIYFLRLENDGIAYESRELPEKINNLEWLGGKKPMKTPDEWLHLMPDFCRVLEEVRPDLIHAGPIPSCGFMAALAGVKPLLVMSWGSDILVDAHGNDFWRWITKYTLDRSDFIVCDCRAVHEAIGRITPYPEEAILQFSWGVDLKKFSPGPDRLQLRKSLGWTKHCVIISTRNWEPIYGLDVVLQAFLLAYRRNAKLRMILLGSGSLKQNVDVFINENGLDNVIYRPGHVSHEKLPDFFRAADLYLSCSYSDGSSVSLLEAMASGLPVIVTDSPGNREWVANGENGWLFPAGDVSYFSEHILQASILSPEERGMFMGVNRKVVEKRADWDANFSKLIELYKRIETRLDSGFRKGGNHDSLCIR